MLTVMDPVQVAETYGVGTADKLAIVGGSDGRLPVRPDGQGAPTSQTINLLQACLAGFSEAIGSLLHPMLLQRTMKRAGSTLGRHLLRQYRLTHRVKVSAGQVDRAELLHDINRHAGWDCRPAGRSDDHTDLVIATCPFGSRASQDETLCLWHAGVCGGIAAEEFGYAKVHVQRGTGVAPQNCLIRIHTNNTDKSVAAEGIEFPVSDDGPQADVRSSERDGLSPRLSPREFDVLKLVGEGLADKEVAATLGLSVRTAENHVARLREKLGTRTRAGLIRFAIRHHVVAP